MTQTRAMSLHRILEGARALHARLRSTARHDLARLRRSTLPGVTFIGITGSAGKTTTKQLAAAILASKAPCMSSRGTGNEHYEVERTILDTTRAHGFCVVELSASRPGYLDRPLQALRPAIGVLTLVAREHYSAFGSREAIAAEKGKLIEALPADGTAVLNIDDPSIREIGERYAGRVIGIGRDEGATLRLLDARSCWPEPLTLQLAFERRTIEARTRLHGVHLALPVLCALGVARAVGISMREALDALALVEPMQGRMLVESTADGVSFVRDDWKAPQWSFSAPLEFLRTARADRKVAVIGNISDSPKSPSQRYAWAARQALEVAHLVVLVGVDARAALKAGAGPGRTLRAFDTVRDAAEFLRAELRAGDLVLLKGTNKQDHLARIVLDRRGSVQCWRSDCGRPEFCGGCPLLGIPSGSQAAPMLVRAPTRRSIVVVGLGNPSADRESSPHNVGHRVLERLARRGAGTWSRQPEGHACSVLLDGEPVELMRPDAAMNLSGPAVQRFLARTGRTAADCIVVHDDADLELGTVREKRSGGDAGHKGIRSIVSAFGTDEFARVRIGIRRPGDTRKATDFVLEPLTQAEETALAPGLDRAETAIRKLLHRWAEENETRSAVGQ